jgi:hypothetical protein
MGTVIVRTHPVFFLHHHLADLESTQGLEDTLIREPSDTPDYSLLRRKPFEKAIFERLKMHRHRLSRVTPGPGSELIVPIAVVT